MRKGTVKPRVIVLLSLVPQAPYISVGEKEHAAWAGSGFDGEDLLLLRHLSPDPGASPTTKRAATITLLPFRSLHSSTGSPRDGGGVVS